MRKASNICDYFVIMSCESEHKTKAMSEVIEVALEKENIHAKSVQGRSNSTWVVIDYLDVMVHIFYQPLRQFYNLEKLWQDALCVGLTDRRKTGQKKKINKKKKNTHGERYSRRTVRAA